jgi:hypothetical protein
MQDDQRIALARALTRMAFEEGARRVRYHEADDGSVDVEVEMAVYQNPKAKPAPDGRLEEPPKPTTGRERDWMDAQGAAVPVLRKRPKED